jgi:transposase
MSRQNLVFNSAELPTPFDYDLLFKNLPKLIDSTPKTGRRPFSKNALLRSLIYKSLRRLATLSDLNFELNNNPSISHALGFNPIGSAPSIERFSSFLHDTPNILLQKIRHQIILELIRTDVITGSTIAADSCPLVVQLKENNLKTAMYSNRFDKTRIPKGDPDARLGVLMQYLSPGKKQVRFFWGYRNHVIIDTTSELPIAEMTQPANLQEVKVVKPLLEELKKMFNLPFQYVIADASYDWEEFLKFIINDLKAYPIIPHNPRRTTSSFGIKKSKIICDAGLPMYRKGNMRNKPNGIVYCQYSCPIIYDKKFQHQYITCPIFHPKFFKGKGCNVLIRLEPSIRAQIDYGTQKFKKIYNSRSSVERIFSRLLSIAMQNPTVKGLMAIKNHATIAHITVLLIAMVAAKTGQKDKIRFIKSFVPNFMYENII